MADSMERLYGLIDELNTLVEDGVPLFPGKILVSQKELYKLTHAFEETVPDEIQIARRIIAKKDEILQEAKMQAERIIQNAENEKYKLLNESNIKREMEEHAEKFRQVVLGECEQIKAQALNDAQETRMTSKNEALAMKDGSQKYAQVILSQLEQILNNLYQAVMNEQQKLQDLKSNDIMYNQQN